MKRARNTSIGMAVVALALIAQSATQAQGKKPNVVILATGGTIAGAAATGTQSGKVRRRDNRAMLAAVPGISISRP